MTNQLDLYIPGFVFATLLNNAAKSRTGVQDGLLFGEINSQVICAISDLQHETFQKKEITIHEFSVNKPNTNFYDHLGGINDQVVDQLITVKQKDVIGYFSIRRNTSTNVSMKERTLANNLLNSKFVCVDKFLILLLTPIYDDNKATYNFLYKVYLCEKNKTPVAEKLNIINLGEGEERHEYLHKSRLLGTKNKPTVGFMRELQDTQAHKFVSETGSVSIVDNSHSLFVKVLKCMKKVQIDLSTCNNDIKSTETEIENLKGLLENNLKE